MQKRAQQDMYGEWYLYSRYHLCSTQYCSYPERRDKNVLLPIVIRKHAREIARMVVYE